MTLAVVPATPWVYGDTDWHDRHAAADTDGHLPLDDAGPPHGEHYLTAWWARRVERWQHVEQTRG